MPIRKSPTPEELFDLLLLGLMWLKESRPDILDRQASTLYSAMCEAEVLGEADRRQIARTLALLTRVVQASEVIRGRRPAPHKLQTLIATSDKYFIVLGVPAEGQFVYNQLVGAHGYTLVLTEAGCAHAQSLVAHYSDVITPQSFADAWERLRSRIVKWRIKERREGGAGDDIDGAGQRD